MFIIFAFMIFWKGKTLAAPVSPAELFAEVVYNFEREQVAAACPGRSAWDIIWSCWATTLTVTWVSVHPNIPWLGEEKWSLLRRRLFLMFLALLAPEIMIMWAFRQWRGAVIIKEMVNKARPNPCKPWTMKHAHFLQMGGFKLICTNDELYDNDFLNESDSVSLNKRYAYRMENQPNMWQGVLTYQRLKDLLSKKKIDFPETTEEEIEDRSKGDALSKGVALLQISWFIVQLVARVCQGLVITEIELTTAALAGLNTIMYLFWWSKPLDVQCPILIRTKEAENVMAGKKPEGGEWLFDEEDCRLEDCFRVTMKGCMERMILDLAAWLYWRHLFQRSRHIYSSFRSTPARAAKAVFRFLNYLKHLGRRGADPSVHDKLIPSIIFGAVYSIWTVFFHKLLYLPYLLLFLPTERVLFPIWLVEPDGFEDVRAKLQSLTSMTLLFDEFNTKWILSMMFYSHQAGKKPLLFFSACAGAVFGSIHCAAWNYPFPSQAEKILWQSASLTFVGFCLGIILGSPLYIFIFFKWGEAYFSQPPTKSYWARLKRPLETTLAVVYPLSRLSLLLVALLSLRNLSDAALETVTWTKIIPHI